MLVYSAGNVGIVQEVYRSHKEQTLCGFLRKGAICDI